MPEAGNEPFSTGRVLPYTRQCLSRQDIEAVVNVLSSPWLTQGPEVARLERAVATYCGAEYAVAVSSGTAALHLACLALDLGPGDRLWTSPLTFVASANCGRYCGATVEFVDIDARHYNLSIAALAAGLERAEQQGTLPKVVVAVHFAGQSVDMMPLQELGCRYGFSVIEDATHALGGRYRGEAVGSCRFSDLAVFSFHPAKAIAGGEGGMIVTNRADLYERLMRLRSHGIVRDRSSMAKTDAPDWYYEQRDLGFNYRLSDLHAALACSQLGRLDEFVVRRRERVQRYQEALADLPLIRPWQSGLDESAWHLYVIQVDEARTRCRRDRLYQALVGAGIMANVHYIPVHLHPYYRAQGWGPGDFPEAESYYRRALTLPLFPAMTDADQNRVIAVLRETLNTTPAA